MLFSLLRFSPSIFTGNVLVDPHPRSSTLAGERLINHNVRLESEQQRLYWSMLFADLFLRHQVNNRFCVRVRKFLIKIPLGEDKVNNTCHWVMSHVYSSAIRKRRSPKKTWESDLSRLKIVSSIFQDLCSLMGRYNHSTYCWYNNDLGIKKCPITSEQADVIFVAQQVTTATLWSAGNTQNYSWRGLWFKNGSLNFFFTWC